MGQGFRDTVTKDHIVQLPRSTSALLSIDLQKEYHAGGAYPVADYATVLANAAALIDAARQASVPVIHVQAWVEEDERARYRLLEECLPEALRSAEAGSVGADICDEVAPLAGETIVQKRWPSAFDRTDLHELLAAAGIENLVVTGVWTESCVRGSVFDAIYSGYRVWLVKDACGSMTATMHRVGLLDMANRLYGGGVLRTAEAVKVLRGDPAEGWRCSRPIEFRYTLDTVDRLYDAL